MGGNKKMGIIIDDDRSAETDACTRSDSVRSGHRLSCPPHAGEEEEKEKNR